MDISSIITICVEVALLVAIGLKVWALRSILHHVRTHTVTILSEDGVSVRGMSAEKAAAKLRVGEARAAYREKLAQDAWVYAQRMTQRENEKMDFALGYARRTQEADDGVVEIKDHEMRLAVEVVAARHKEPKS